jgi:raffinose/stachyose/melibiose transport system permease protein
VAATTTIGLSPARTAARRVRQIFAPVPAPYLFMLIPAIGIFTLFITLPALDGMFFSLTDYVGYGAWKFIGLANYQAALSDPTILDSYGFTLLFAVVSTIVVNVTALLLALALNSKIRWQKGFRAVFFLPMVISGLVISYVFSYLFSTSLPLIASGLGVSPLTTSLLANQHLAWLCVVFVASWQACPGAIIIYLAGLISIPGEVYEAASIDGATNWRRFRYMTFPLLFPFFLINTVLEFKNFLNVFDIVVGLTNGGPGTATTSVAMSIFNGLNSGDYSYQMANGVIFFIVCLTLSILQLRIIRGRGGAL